MLVIVIVDCLSLFCPSCTVFVYTPICAMFFVLFFIMLYPVFRPHSSSHLSSMMNGQEGEHEGCNVKIIGSCVTNNIYNCWLPVIYLSLQVHPQSVIKMIQLNSYTYRDLQFHRIFCQINMYFKL